MSPNKYQRAVIIACLMAFFCACLWIPWSHKAYGRSLGYGWLWSGPSGQLEFAQPEQFAQPDLRRIALTLAAIGALASALYFVCGSGADR